MERAKGGSVKRRMSTLAACAGLLALVAAACGGSSDATGGEKLSGSIVGDGSSTVFPITQAVAEEFNKEQPDVKISVGTSGTGGGFEKFCNGETDISDASRPIKDEEKSACEKMGVRYVELQVAIDGLSVLVNPENAFAGCLTTAELKKIWEPKSTVRTWSQVRSGFPNKPITLYGPGTDSGTFDFFTQVIVGEEGASRSDYTASEDDNVLVQGIAGDPNALGYFGFAYYEQNKDKLKLVGVDPGTGCVTPTKETINSGTYKPLSRPLFIYVSKDAAAKPVVQAFIDFYLATVNDIIADVGYVAMHANAAAKSLQDWETFKAGA
jgi:phosphate transport system substrate-binding protein